MPSVSPSANKPPRPSIEQRSKSASSTISLSNASSGTLKPAGHAHGAAAGVGGAKAVRPHLVSRQSRNVSHGRGLSNMGKKSMNAVYGDGKGHKRNKSGATTPTASPRSTTDGHMKRNSSHVVLPKNRSHGNLNLRKNKSTNTLTALNRNLSRGALNKLGAPAEQKARAEDQQKQGVFDLGNNSSEGEEGGEWEDSTASPELTRNNSKVSTPARAHTPNGEPIQKPPTVRPVVPDEKTSSPPEPSVLKNNKSAPDLHNQRTIATNRPRVDPALLQQNGRSSRAPPAMSTAIARSSQVQLNRNESQRSLAKQDRASVETSVESIASKTPATSGVGTSSSQSGSAGVSHFLAHDRSLPQTHQPRGNAYSDDDESVSDFMSTYKPQASESPEKSYTQSRAIHNINKARVSAPSRTNQKLELQRREVMRGSGPPPTGSTGMGLSAGSSISLHTRSASKGRARSLAGDLKIIKQDYESAVRQLTVVRRFRNPVLESLNRVKAAGGTHVETSSAAASTQSAQKRPPSRHGRAASATTNTAAPATSNGTVRTPAGTTPEDRGTNHQTKTVSFRPGGRESTGRVQFQLSRQASHDDILTTSHGSPEAHHDDLINGLNPEEAMIRRMWESRITVA